MRNIERPLHRSRQHNNAVRFKLAAALLPVLACHPCRAADYLTMSGEALYTRFCAACHGASGHGDGPVASSFKSEVPDLTLLTRRRGSFPADLIERVIDGRYIIAAHGSRTMPVWGEEFTLNDLGNPNAEQATRTIISRITEYIGSIQQPPFNRGK